MNVMILIPTAAPVHGGPTQTIPTAPPGHGALEAAVKAAEPQVRMAILKELLHDTSLFEQVLREDHVCAARAETLRGSAPPLPAFFEIAGATHESIE